MDISRLKKMFAGVSAAAIMLSSVATAIAAYSDVPSGAWYETAVKSFMDAGYLDASQANFRGQDNANRAEFTKLVVELNGGVLNTAPAVPSFDDVATGAWYYKYMEEAGKEGWVRGDGSCYGKHPCYARPSGNINRAEAAAIIVRAFGLESTSAAAQFVDNPSGQWYTADIQTAADHCVLQGDDSTGRVRPSDNMNRAEMVVMLHRVDQGMKYGTDCGPKNSAPAVSDATATAATKVEVTFNVPVDQTTATNKAMYTITPALAIDSLKLVGDKTVELTLATAMDANSKYTLSVVDMQTVAGVKFSGSKDFNGYTSIVQGNGTLEVSLSAKNPVGDTVPKGAQGIVFASLDLTAAADDVSIENLTVLHSGFGNTSDFTGVYGLVNGARVTRKRTIDSQSATATIRFTTPLVVAAGKTVTLQLAGDLSATAATSAEHTLAVELPSDVISNAKTVKGNFPLSGKIFRVAAVAAGQVTITYRSVTPATAKVGDTGVKIGKFEVAVNGTEDQTLYSMTLKNDGTVADGDIKNISLRRSDGTVLTKTVAQTTNNYVTLVFDPPFTMLQGDHLVFDVVGDIVAGAAKNVKMFFDETGDVFSVGSLYGYGVNGQLYGAGVTLTPTPVASAVTIDAGQFTMSIDGPVTTQYTAKDKNAVLANVWFEPGKEPVDVQQLFVAIQGVTSTGISFAKRLPTVDSTTLNTVAHALENVELRNTTTGRTISGVEVLGNGQASAGLAGATTSGSYAIYRFDDFQVSAKQKYELRVNFIDNSATTNAAPANGDKFRVFICGEATYYLSGNSLVTNPTGCNMGGLIASSTAYQMKITGVSTNDRIGDFRPGGVLSGNFQEIRTSSLTITVKPTVATGTAVRNAKDVNFYRFEAKAGDGKAVLLTNLILKGASGITGTVQNATNYALWVDTNADGNVDQIIQSGVASQGSTITFDKLTGGGYVVKKSTTVVFEVHADIAASVTANNTLALMFNSGSTFVDAEQVDDGTSLSGIGVKAPSSSLYSSGDATSAIQVQLATAPIYTLTPQGNLFVTRSSDVPKSRMTLGGVLGDEVLRLQFLAQYEDVVVTDVVFTGTGTNASAFTTDVDHLELYKVGATTPFANATACSSTTMCVKLAKSDTSFVIKKGETLNVLVRPKLNSDEQGAISGHLFGIALSGPSIATAVQATGLLSSMDLSTNDSTGGAVGEVIIGNTAGTANTAIAGNTNTVVLSKLVAITNADPNTNGTAIPTGTSKAIAQFKFSAAANSNTKNGVNKFMLSGAIFNVNATNVLLGTGDQTGANSDFYLYNKNDPSTRSRCFASVVTVSGSNVLVSCPSLTATTVNTKIDAGSDTTFVLQSDVVNGKISNGSTSTLQVSLNNFSDSTSATFTTTTSHLNWTDFEDTTAAGSLARFLWVEYPDTTVNGTSYNG